MLSKVYIINEYIEKVCEDGNTYWAGNVLPYTLLMIWIFQMLNMTLQTGYDGIDINMLFVL